MVAQTALVDELQSLVGREHAFAPPDGRPFAVDGTSPEAVVEAGSYEDVAAVVRFASDEGLAVIPWGNGGLMQFGNVPGRYDIALSLSRLNAIIEYEPADMTVTCQAGISMGDLNGRLGENAQTVPFGFSASNRHQVGGLLAANHTQLRLTYGTPRDFAIGMRVVTADGRITRAGGKVVKNVAGYDLCKLYIGSLGTLGVIVEATFKLFPVSQAGERIDLAFERAGDACRFARELQRRGLSLSEMDLQRRHLSESPAADSYVLRVELAGSVGGVERSRNEIQELAGEYGARRCEPAVRQDALMEIGARNHGDALTCRISALPTAVPDLIESLDSEAPEAHIWSASPIFGTVYATWPGAGDDVEFVERVRAVTSHVGGTLVVTGCSLALKRRIDVFGDPPPAFELMRRVKQQFDPTGILSPGRFVGRL